MAVVPNDDGFQAPNPADLARLLSDEPEPKPEFPLPSNPFHRLPGGLVLDEQSLYEVEVRELNGEDEEKINRARQSDDPTHWLSTILLCGVESIEGVNPTPELLNSLLIGDREYLALAIRVATFGDQIEYGEVTCPACSNSFELTLEMSDIPVTKMESTDRQIFLVPLRKGGKARVRMPTGADQRDALSDPKATTSERNSVMLSRCVVELIDARGNSTLTAGMPSLVQALGVSDRQKILLEIAERAVGPRYDEVKVVHDDCGKTIDVPIGLMDLFPGL